MRRSRDGVSRGVTIVDLNFQCAVAENTAEHVPLTERRQQDDRFQETIQLQRAHMLSFYHG